MTPIAIPAIPLELRCLALTGTFETGKPTPHQWTALSGDFDGQGISFSVLQWNFGQKTLQPLLEQMAREHTAVLQECFGDCYIDLEDFLDLGWNDQMSRCRQEIQTTSHVVMPEWRQSFERLGQTLEWQSTATQAAATSFNQAKFLASKFGLTRDRAIALMFDCAVQNGGVNSAASAHINAALLANPHMPESDRLVLIANNIADACNPQWRLDVLSRKMAIATGAGRVHGIDIDLKNYGLT
jgi:hypothetical protein